jgi:hypothetical protein
MPFASSPPEGSQWWKEASVKGDTSESGDSRDSEVFNEEQDYSWGNWKEKRAVLCFTVPICAFSQFSAGNLYVVTV